jgi:NAD(P)-dependent dehydrogenase (short-subunit alcohol dehydrogenase family)
MNRLSNKVAAITGGSSGIGLAAAKQFIAEGAQVAIFARSRDQLDQALAALGPQAIGIAGDVANAEDVARFYAKISETYGRLDIVFANAAIADFRPLSMIDDAHFDALVGINLRGVINTVQQAVPLMTEGGSIVLTTASANTMGIPGAAVYSATKAAVRSLARSFSAELVGSGIRVNAISPGAVRTPAFERLGATSPEVKAAQDQSVAAIPVKRVAEAEEMAKAVTFLASDDSSYVVGSELVVDGGMTQL